MNTTIEAEKKFSEIVEAAKTRAANEIYDMVPHLMPEDNTCPFCGSDTYYSTELAKIVGMALTLQQCQHCDGLYTMLLIYPEDLTEDARGKVLVYMR